jgi:hypothetical protein
MDHRVVNARDRRVAATVWRVRTAAVVVVGGFAVVGMAWAAGNAFGYRTLIFAWTLHFVLMAWISGVVDTAKPGLRGRWFWVREWESSVHRRLGAWWYMRFLHLVGWERLTRRGAVFTGTRASLAALDRQTRQSEFSHLIIAVLVTTVSAVAALAGAWDAAVWLSGLTLVLHVYPILLQRALRARIQRLQARRAP